MRRSSFVDVDHDERKGQERDRATKVERESEKNSKRESKSNTPKIKCHVEDEVMIVLVSRLTAHISITQHTIHHHPPPSTTIHHHPSNPIFVFVSSPPV